MQRETFNDRLNRIRKYANIFEQGKAYTRKEIETLIKEYRSTHRDIWGLCFSSHQLNTIFTVDHSENFSLELFDEEAYNTEVRKYRRLYNNGDINGSAYRTLVDSIDKSKLPKAIITAKRNYYVLKTELDLCNDFNYDIDKQILALVAQRVYVKG